MILKNIMYYSKHECIPSEIKNCTATSLCFPATTPIHYAN